MTEVFGFDYHDCAAHMNGTTQDHKLRAGCLWPLFIASALVIQLTLLAFYPGFPWAGASGSPAGPYIGLYAGIGLLVLIGFAAGVGLVSLIVFTAMAIVLRRQTGQRLALLVVAIVSAVNVSLLLFTRVNTEITRQVAYKEQVRQATMAQAKMEVKRREQAEADQQFRQGKWTHSEGSDLDLLWDATRSSLWSISSAQGKIFLKRWQNDAESAVESHVISGERSVWHQCIRDGHYFTMVGNSGRAEIYVYSLEGPRLVEKILATEADHIGMLAVSRDGRLVAVLAPGSRIHNGTSSYTLNALHLWDRSAQRSVWQSPPQIYTHRIALSDDGRLVAAYPPQLRSAPGDSLPDPDDRLIIWDTDSGSEQLAVAIAGTPIAFNGNGDLLAIEVVNLQGTSEVKVIRTGDGRVIGSFSVDFDSPTDLIWGIDGNPFWVTARNPLEFIVCDLAAGATTRRALQYRRSDRSRLLLTPDLRVLYVAERGAILRFDLETGQEISTP